MHLSGTSSLPIINIRKFDHLQRQYQQIAPVIASDSNCKKSSLKPDFFPKHQDLQNKKNKSKERFQTLDSLSLTCESRLRLQYRSKYFFLNHRSIHYFKTLSLARIRSQSQESVNKINPIRMIEKEAVLSKIPKLFAGKYMQKMQQFKQTKYEEWMPNMIVVRNEKKLPQATKKKLKQLENSFFNRCRTKNSILKLSSKNQHMQK